MRSLPPRGTDRPCLHRQTLGCGEHRSAGLDGPVALCREGDTVVVIAIDRLGRSVAKEAHPYYRGPWRAPNSPARLT